MMADKKKLLVIAALGLVIVCVGAFQFMMGSPAPAPAPAKKKEEPKKAEEPTAEPLKNPAVAAPLPARDPFASTTAPQPAPVQPPQEQPKNEPKVDKIPAPNFDKSGGFGGGIGTEPVKITAVPQELKFNFTVSGVMLGARPVAVFTDAQGEQRLVPAGGSLDADTRVISIDKDAVTVKFHGKTMRLTVEGNPNDK